MKNKKFDKMICEQFLDVQIGGVDFGAGIIKDHPALISVRKVDKDKAKKIINDYFNKFYTKFDLDLDDTVEKVQRDWASSEKLFFNACDKYFNNHPWPDGRYEAYLSIINCNPRFIDNKIFQFYWKNKDDFLSIAVHEMLHFLFYDLVTKFIPNTDLQSQKIWEISEVFNGLIMAEPDFVDITKIKIPRQYPNLVNLQEELQRVWNENKIADKFILSILS